MPLTITYVHDHECSQKGEKYATLPPSRNGVSEVTPPICEETLTELVRLTIERY